MIYRQALSTRDRGTPSITTGLLLLLSGVFAVAAWQKVLTFSQLEESMTVSRLVPGGLETAAAAALVGAEVLVPVLLLIPRFRPLALWIAMGLSGIFFGYSAWRIHQDIRVPCSCFGALFKIEPWQSMVISFLIALTSISLMRKAAAVSGVTGA